MVSIFTPLVPSGAVLFAQLSMIVVQAFYVVPSLSLAGCTSVSSSCHHKENFGDSFVLQAIPSKIRYASFTNHPGMDQVNMWHVWVVSVCVRCVGGYLLSLWRVGACAGAPRMYCMCIVSQFSVWTVPWITNVFVDFVLPRSSPSL